MFRDRLSRGPVPLILLVVCVLGGLAGASLAVGEGRTAMFTPGDDVEGAIVAKVDAARSSVRMQAYSFTSRPIADALVRAKRRGLDVRAIVDAGRVGEPSCRAILLREAGAVVLVDHAHAIAHNKILILDGRSVVTGSYNFTAAAQHANAENCLFLDDIDLAARYAAEWARHANHSPAYEPTEPKR